MNQTWNAWSRCCRCCWLLLSVVALSTTLQQVQSFEFNPSQCPQWLRDYEAFHVANRGAQGAKYLLADAPGFVGVGDHLRGFMYALRAAAGTKRVLLVRWENPGNLTDFLIPGSSIDWTFKGTPAEAFSAYQLRWGAEDMDIFSNKELGNLWPSANFFESDPSNKTFLMLKTNFPADQKCIICPEVDSRPGQTFSQTQTWAVCLFRFLFKPSPQLEQTTEQYMRNLYPNWTPEMPYVAVHLRLGHMKGEDSTINRIAGIVDPLAKFLLAVSCGRGLAGQAGVDIATTPLLLLADHRGVRQFSRHGKLANVVTPSYDAVHTKMNSANDHLLSFVDLNMMARAKCIVTSHSGFSNVGWWMSGGNTCRMMLSECYKTCSSDPNSPFCN